MYYPNVSQRQAEARAHQKPAVLPGKILKEEFLGPCEITPHRLALVIGVPPRRINEIILGKRSITVDTALRLEAFFHVEAEFWMKLQAAYDLARARKRIQTPNEEIDHFWHYEAPPF